jgi:hypothetical protein
MDRFDSGLIVSVCIGWLMMMLGVLAYALF